MTSPQWTVAADGPEKRALANRLAAGAGRRFAQGGLVHRGQGKWYPGEPLPRWQIGLLWRTDGEPLWSDRRCWPTRSTAAAGGRRCARPAPKRSPGRSPLTSGCRTSSCRPCFEDPLARAGRRGRPAGGASRHRTSRSGPIRDLVGELDRVSRARPAWALPLVPSWFGEGWASPDWRTARGRLVLLPGESPAGMRLPLTRCPGPTPTTPARRRTPRRSRRWPRRPTVAAGGRGRPRRRYRARTALVVEARDGFVHVFLPPLEKLEKFAELVGVVDRGASADRDQIVLEGYGPPPDPRITQPDGHARPRRDRGQRAPDLRAGPSWPTSPRPCTRPPAPMPAGHREVRPRRPAHRHRRRQPHHPRRRGAGRVARCCAGPTCWSACSPTGSTTRRCPTCSPAASSARPARRRGSTRAGPRPCTSWRSPSPRSPGWPTEHEDPQHRPWVGRPGAAAPAHRHHRQHPPGRVLHRQALQPRLARAAGSACSSCAASRCRRTREMALVQALLVRALVARFAEEPLLAPAGALGHRAARAASCCRTSPMADLGRGGGRPAGARPRRSTWPGSTRTWSSGSRGSGMTEVGRRSSSSCARPSSRGTCSARSRRRRHRALRRLLGRAAAGRGPRLRARPGTCVTATGCRCRCSPTGDPGPATSPASATGPGSPGRRCTRRWRSHPAALRRGRPRQPGTSRAAPPTTSCTRAAARTTTRRSTPTRPRRAGPAGSRRSATLRGWSTSRHWTPSWPGARPACTEYPLTLDLRRRVPQRWGRG